MPMYGWNDGWSWWAMAVWMIVLWGVVVAGVVILVRVFVRPGSPTNGGEMRKGSRARRILEERFARGEIDEEELRSRLQTLFG